MLLTMTMYQEIEAANSLVAPVREYFVKDYTVKTIYIRSFSLLNLEQNTSYSFLMSCSDRQDNLWTSEKIKFDTGALCRLIHASHNYLKRH